MIQPERLNKGDTIGIVSPSSPPNKKALHNGITMLQKMGLHVMVGNNMEKEYGYLAGRDEDRWNDFNEMIARKSVKAIIFARGGYGAARIAPYIDYHLIAQNPKIIWGYSDITYLHTAIRQRTGLITFHGPMTVSIGKDNVHPLSIKMFRQLFQPTELFYSEKISPLHVISRGKATGQLVGGNLSLITRSLGTPFEMDTKEKIILIEDIGEEPYKVDAMLNQLKLAGKLKEATGVIVGDFAEAAPKETPTLTMHEVFHHYFSKLDIPVLAGVQIGHCEPNFSVPLGVKATIDADKKTIWIEPGVK
ncbi:S66 peptidase family protein [Virgibacillus sp. W0181]|uniref:S66 peptidase family protein n=1 Tax=Virgibacillus sp. W0181 TaxID=3391581 RepID=UPI003F46BA40